MITHQLGTAIDGAAIGRYTFEARNGAIDGTTTVPEPSSVILWSALGIAGLAIRRRAREK